MCRFSLLRDSIFVPLSLFLSYFNFFCSLVLSPPCDNFHLIKITHFSQIDCRWFLVSALNNQISEEDNNNNNSHTVYHTHTHTKKIVFPHTIAIHHGLLAAATVAIAGIYAVSMQRTKIKCRIRQKLVPHTKRTQTHKRKHSNGIFGNWFYCLHIPGYTNNKQYHLSLNSNKKKKTGKIVYIPFEHRFERFCHHIFEGLTPMCSH